MAKGPPIEGGMYGVTGQYMHLSPKLKQKVVADYSDLEKLKKDGKKRAAK